MAPPKPTPTALKLLKGNPGRRPINKSEPQPDKGIPKCPAWLSPKAKTAWKEIATHVFDMGVLTQVDGKALELLCDAYAEYREAREVVYKNGATYECETRNGYMLRTRPEVAIAGDAWRRVRAMMCEFGLTPSSRSKLSTGEKVESDPMESILNGTG